MPATFLKGDLFQHEGLSVFAHGCNCAGAMGKGIALEFRNRFPLMYREYKERCAAGQFGLGDVFQWSDGSTTVFNLGTQVTWKAKADISAIDTAVTKMVAIAESEGIVAIGLARIGAGLGRLPWPDVRSLLQTIGERTRLELLVFEEFQARSERNGH